MFNVGLEEPAATSLWVAIVCCTVVSAWIAVRKRGEGNDSDEESSAPVPPMASSSGFLGLGHAMAYKKDPPGFLTQQENSYGKVFQINLAGRVMTVIGSDRVAMKQVASLPESVASSRKAVAEIGFEYTLGDFNVYKGTDWHKRIIRDYVLNPSLWESHSLPRFHQCLSDALQQELQHAPLTTPSSAKDVIHIADLFQIVRRCILRASLDCLVSPLLLESCPNQGQDLVTNLMHFQDQVEDATAKAAILPWWISVPLILQPVARMRNRLAKQLAAKIEHIVTQQGNASQTDAWLQVFFGSDNVPTNVDKDISYQDAAQLVLGLLFAAHKNPAIGAAQAYCFLATQTSLHQYELAKKESIKFLKSFPKTTNDRIVRRCVLETLRVTAHTIGAVRLAQESFTLQTESPDTIFQINKGTTLAISHITSHTNSASWGADGAEFRLDRKEWNADANDKSNSGRNKSSMASPVDEYKFTTFSNGLHKCPGERIAIAVMELMVALLLKHETQLVGDLPSVSFERATLAQREGPVPVTMRL